VPDGWHGVKPSLTSGKEQGGARRSARNKFAPDGGADESEGGFRFDLNAPSNGLSEHPHAIVGFSVGSSLTQKAFRGSSEDEGASSCSSLLEGLPATTLTKPVPRLSQRPHAIWVCSENHGIGFVRRRWKAFWSWLIATPTRTSNPTLHPTSLQPSVGAAISRDNDDATAVLQGVIFRPSLFWAKFHGALGKLVGTG